MNVRFIERFPKALYGISALLSLVISWFVCSQKTVINPDAICYLSSAEILLQSGLHQAMHLCPQAIWPFYSTAIAFFSSFTHLDFTTSAFVLDALFSALTVCFFVAIVFELGGSARTGWFAAATILTAHHFNLLRQEIIRDHGFWCGYLFSFYLFLRFCREPRWMTALAWSASLLLATLFRIEGAVFLFAAPLFVWMQRGGWGRRFKAFMMLNAPLFIVLLGLGVYLALSPAQTFNQLGRLSDLSHQWHDGLHIVLDNIQRMREAISTHVLGAPALRDTTVVTVLLLISWYVVNVVSNLSLVYTGLALYGWRLQRRHLASSARWAVLAYLIVNVSVTTLFFLEHQFLARRYLIALSLILMLAVPFALERLFTPPIKRRWMTVGVAVWLAISAIGGLWHFGHSKAVLKEAGGWLSGHLQQTDRLYVNDYQMMYYSKHFGFTLFQTWDDYQKEGMPSLAKLKHYDYVALLTHKKQEDAASRLVQTIKVKPLQVFSNQDGDVIYIYHWPSHRNKESVS
jgi:hypothetical protein